MQDIAAVLIGVLLLSVPIVYITACTIKEILQTLARYRLARLAYVERIAMVERGAIGELSQPSAAATQSAPIG